MKTTFTASSSKSSRPANVLFKTTLLATGLVLAALGSVSAQTSPMEIGAGNRGSNPFGYVGRVTFKQPNVSNMLGIGTGTAIRPNSVLTAGHVVYTIGKGWNNTVNFEWGRYDSAVYKISAASRLAVLGGYSNNSANNTNSAFSSDMGIINSVSQVANGAYAAHWSYPALLTTTGYTKMSLGYAGAPYGTAARIMKSGSIARFYQVAGGFYNNPSYGIWEGMSGGPVFVWANNAWWVAAINICGPTNNDSSYAGVRVLDNDAENFIKSYAY